MTSETTPTTTTVRLCTPGEVAALVPHLTGFRPRESLVAVSLRGPRRRIGLTARVDLVDHPDVVEQVVGALVRDGARAVLLLVHTELPSHGVHPFSRLVDDVQRRLDQEGVELQEALLVRSGRWWSYRCEQPCCPASGRPVDDGSRALQLVAAENALAGRVPLGSREDLVASIAPVLPYGPALARRLQEQAAEDVLARWTGDPARTRQDELDRWSDALDAWPGLMAPAEVASLVAGLHLVGVRDEVAAWGLSRHDELVGLLMQLCRAAVAPDDAPLCAVLAWVAYAHGSGALALVAVQRALATDPDLTLAQLLLHVVDRTVPPEQVRRVLWDAAPVGQRPSPARARRPRRRARRDR